MSVAKWATPSSRSSTILGTSANSLGNGSESTAVTYDNSTNKDLYACVTVKLGSFTPTTGGSITLRVNVSDGTDTADRAAGDLYTAVLLSGLSAKVVIFPMVRLYPLSMRFSIINNSGASFAASSNDLHVRPYNEDIV